VKLYKHQQDAVQRATEDNLALFHECGTGKTLTALKIIEHHRATGCGPALVVCPLSIIEAAWMADAAKFAPELKVVSLWAKTRQKRLDALATDADIYVVNFESFRGLFSEIQAKGFEVLIVDESSKMKSHSSQITRALLAMAGVFSRGKGRKFAVNTPVPHRYILTGTPAPNDRSEYWAQITFIAPNTVFSDNFFAFRSRYFTAKPLGRTGISLWSFTKDPLLAGEFNEKMAPVCDVVSKEDAVDLPDQVHEIRKVKLNKNEQAAYDTFRRDFCLRFADEEVLATTALTELMKARQLTSGFCYGREGAYSIGYSKLKELKSLLEEIGSKPVIIWCNFQQEVELLLREIPDALALWGGTDDRAAVIKQFKEGTASCLIANPQSAAHGLTFVNASNAVYYSMTYSYELLKQSQDRIHRIGQKKKCTYYYLLADGTIDEVIYKAVQEKKDLSESVLQYLKNGN
jgi:SNF2 family DNA or RNA helicase